MRKMISMMLWGVVALTAVSDTFDGGGDDPSSCLAPFGTNYEGYLQDSAGKKIAAVEMRESRGSKNGSRYCIEVEAKNPAL